MRNNRLITLSLVLLLCSLTLVATNRTITFARSGENITAALQQQVQDLRRGDSLEIVFGQGKFYLDNQVEILANTTIKGQGADKSAIILLNNPEFRHTYYLRFNGKKGSEISVEISDLSIDMVRHDDIWWEDDEKIVMGFIHANPVKIHDIKSNIGNARCTTIDMWVCSNVDITRCELVNNNNCRVGGLLWFRRDMHNISITDNKLVKHGNDEVLAFWDNGNDFRGPRLVQGVKENIVFKGNEVVFTRPSGADKMRMDVAFAFFNGNENADSMSIDFHNIAIEDNNITVDIPVVNLMNFAFGPLDHCNGIHVANNTITYTEASSIRDTHNTTIHLMNRSQIVDTLFVENNTITADAIAIDKYGNSHRFLAIVNGGCLQLDSNTFIGTVITDDNRRYGTALIWARGLQSDLILTGNTFNNIYKLATLSSDYSPGTARLTAVGNTFDGDTRIYCNNMERVDLTMTDNVFYSNCYEVLLQEFGQHGSLVFTGNEVHAERGGSIFTHYNNKDISSMRFDRLTVSDNELHGIDSRSWVPERINAPRREVRSNKYR